MERLQDTCFLYPPVGSPSSAHQQSFHKLKIQEISGRIKLFPIIHPAPLPFPVPAPWLKTSTSNPETHPTRVPARIKTHRKFSLNREPVSASDSSHQIGSGGLNQYKGKKTSKTQHRHVRCFISLVMASDEVALSPEIHDGTKRLESQLNNAVPIGCRFRSSIGGNN